MRAGGVSCSVDLIAGSPVRGGSFDPLTGRSTGYGRESSLMRARVVAVGLIAETKFEKHDIDSRA